ncbi:MAG: MarR family winged helix-turn-helix transcriptional regulator [Ancalomicrobiaceae bacterium]|nr:MarR family winged helix-turn-helix transcriptional regulator [Ancalomicrobiaceae bacterium]
MADEMNGVWETCSSASVKRASRRLGQLYEDVLKPTGLRGTQFTLLAQIGMAEAPSLRQLAAALVMDLSALGHTLKPLTRDGLVSLVADASDKRVKRVILTPDGRARLAEAQRHWAVAQRRFEQVLGPDEAKALRQVLAEVSSPDFAARFAAAGREGGEPPAK